MSLTGRQGRGDTDLQILLVIKGGKCRPDLGVKSRPSPSGSITPSASTSGAQLFGTWLQEELPASRILDDVSVYCNTSIVRTAY